MSLFGNKLFSSGLQLRSLSIQEREKRERKERKETLSQMDTSCATAEGLMMLRALVPAGFLMPTGRVRPCPHHQAGNEIKREISFRGRNDCNVAARSFWQADLRKKQVLQVLSSTRHEPHRYVHFDKFHIECHQGRKSDRKQTKSLQRERDTEREREREGRAREGESGDWTFFAHQLDHLNDSSNHCVHARRHAEI